jgi:hypothetical protein
LSRDRGQSRICQKNEGDHDYGADSFAPSRRSFWDADSVHSELTGTRAANLAA